MCAGSLGSLGLVQGSRQGVGCWRKVVHGLGVGHLVMIVWRRVLGGGGDRGRKWHRIFAYARGSGE